MNKQKTTNANSANIKDQYLQQLAQLEEMMKKELHGQSSVEDKEDIELEDYTINLDNKSRYEVPVPEPLDKSQYNIDGIVDIITFVKHPHFLGLTPMPWQELILKLFYMGTPGNTHLAINIVEESQRQQGCKGCIWEFVKNDEEKFNYFYKQGKRHSSILLPQNSPCLTCSRLNEDVRATRYEYERKHCKSALEEKKVTSLLERDIEDRFSDEADLINNPDLDQLVTQQIERKIGNLFQELVLILGRRSGKSFITSVMALYELYKLLSMKHPQSRYGLLEFDEIYILNVASNEDTAKTAVFSKIKSTVNASPFFQPYIGKDIDLEMRFLTEHDLAESKRRVERGLNPFVGSIIMRCGTSNAAGLVGKTCWCIIMDEVVAMAGEKPDGGNDFVLYEDLKPSVSTFGDDSKFILLSQPKGPVGLMYDLYVNRMTDNTTLILKLPTWISNPKIDIFWLDKERAKDPKTYNMQYGAEFGAASETPFLPEELIERAFANSTKLMRTESKALFFDYFCHVDPARTSDYYALCIAHLEPSGRRNPLGKEMKKAVIDHMHFWAPLGKNQPVSPEDVEKYIVDLHARFKFKQVSFDQWHSQSTIVNLQQRGIPSIIKTFNKDYKEKIYGNLYDLFSDELIEFYQISGGFYIDSQGNKIDINEVEEAKNQFYYLQKKWSGTRYKIEALRGYKDDLPDCIAAACYEAINAVVLQPPLPKSKIVYNYGRMR